MKLQNTQITDSSLLIPKKFLDVYEKKTAELSRKDYFHIVLHRYKELIFSGLHPQSKKPKTLYQDTGQNLVKINFKPSNEDWLEFGILASFLGISRTRLFNWFLMLELAGWEKITEMFFDSGVPTNFSTIMGKNSLSRHFHGIWKRKIYYKIRI
ncbi:MAG: DUF1564 family protein [Leptospiraceae bacterium]|nr:DUF1564 family protein [Leptospiraceae bacterium]